MGEQARLASLVPGPSLKTLSEDGRTAGMDGLEEGGCDGLVDGGDMGTYQRHGVTGVFSVTFFLSTFFPLS